MEGIDDLVMRFLHQLQGISQGPNKKPAGTSRVKTKPLKYNHLGSWVSEVEKLCATNQEAS